MDSRLLSPPPFLISLYFLFLVGFVEIPIISLCDDDLYSICSSSFDCGQMKLGFPFWGGIRDSGCGHPVLKLNCDEGVATMEIMEVVYRVLDVSPKTRTLKIAREDYWTGICSPKFVNTTFDPTLFDLGFGYQNLTLSYGCSPLSPDLPTPLSCPSSGYVYIDWGAHGPNSCKISVVIPILDSDTLDAFFLPNLEQDIKEGFDVQWKIDTAACRNCTAHKGVCGYNPELNQPTCYFPPAKPEGLWKPTLLTRVLLPISIFLVVVISFVIIYRKRLHFPIGLMIWERDIKHDQLNAKEIMKNFGSIYVGSISCKRYTYSDVKKLTNSFKEKVGQGGYGIVYKGKLFDGRVVAVKILNESKGNGEEFINEVVSISRTSHVNIVNLLGFCYERTRRALIYEFMSNGSLDKLIYDKGSSTPNSHLDSKTMFQIAIGIARGLEYLHKGCNTRILHFDIKPHNILLDEDLCPKISDFGLAKLCKPKESIVSMTGMRGTAGYIAPEVFNRYFGKVSNKSDVYSYGMLVLEMNGARKRFGTRDSCNNEVNFPHGIYDKLEQGESFGIFEGIAEEEEDIIKKMIIVSLWCVQINPLDRPSMCKVIEMLEGTLQSLQVPPKHSFVLPNSPP